MTDERRSFNGYVGTKDGVITEIGTGAPPKNRDGTNHRRLRLHAHAGINQRAYASVSGFAARGLGRSRLMPWLKRIYGCARVLRPEHFYTGSLLGCVEAIRSGVTTVCEHNFLNPSAECAFATIGAIRTVRLARGFRAHDYGHRRDRSGLYERKARAGVSFHRGNFSQAPKRRSALIHDRTEYAADQYNAGFTSRAAPFCRRSFSASARTWRNRSRW